MITSNIDQAITILKELRTGKYYPASNVRSSLVGQYQDVVASLPPDDYEKLKLDVIGIIPSLIEEREKNKIAYSLLSNIIRYSCVGDIEVFEAYEKEIFRLASIDKRKYLYHLITLAQTKSKLSQSISNIEDFFIEKYLVISRVKTINFQYLTDFTTNVKLADKRKLLAHLFKSMPFRNDKQFINRYIVSYNDLSKYAILI